MNPVITPATSGNKAGEGLEKNAELFSIHSQGHCQILVHDKLPRPLVPAGNVRNGRSGIPPGRPERKEQ